MKRDFTHITGYTTGEQFNTQHPNCHANKREAMCKFGDNVSFSSPLTSEVSDKKRSVGERTLRHKKGRHPRPAIRYTVGVCEGVLFVSPAPIDLCTSFQRFVR